MFDIFHTKPAIYFCTPDGATEAEIDAIDMLNIQNLIEVIDLYFPIPDGLSVPEYHSTDPPITIRKTWAMPNSSTVKIKPIRQFIEAEASKGGVIVDPFAGECPYGTLTNDINPDYPTDCHTDALTFLRALPSSFADLVIYDPPYSLTTAAIAFRIYGTQKVEPPVSNMGYWAGCKNEIARILKPGGRCISCGWNTNGLGKNRGFYPNAVLIVNHGGSRNDTLCLLETKYDLPP